MFYMSHTQMDSERSMRNLSLIVTKGNCLKTLKLILIIPCHLKTMVDFSLQLPQFEIKVLPFQGYDIKINKHLIYI